MVLGAAARARCAASAAGDFLTVHILHIYKDYFPVLGGIENHIRVLAEAQAAAGHQVTALVCDPGVRTRVIALDGVRVVKAGRLRTVASMPISFSQPWLALRQRADVIHVHSPYPLGELSGWLLGRGTAFVITHHSDVVRQQGWLRLYAPLLRRVLRRADCIIATSPRYIETSPWLRPVADRCTVVPLGVDVGRFAPPPQPFIGPPTLLFAGRLRYYKGLDALLRALPALPDVTLKVVGDGPQRAAWMALAQELGIAGRVRWIGEASDDALPMHYRQAHLFVLPANARAEAFGTVLLEAMASGLPCVTTEVGTGTSWVVQEGVTGRVVPPNDPPALAAAIGELLANDELRSRMGRAGRERVLAEFDQAKMVERVMGVYMGVHKEVAGS